MQLPDELKQAIDNNAFCALSTKINEKEMQNHLMWVDYKDNKILINTDVYMLGDKGGCRKYYS